MTIIATNINMGTRKHFIRGEAANSTLKRKINVYFLRFYSSNQITHNTLLYLSRTNSILGRACEHTILFKYSY